MLNDARCTSKIKSRIANAALNRRLLFHKKIWLKIKEETSKILHLEHNFFWC